MAAQQQSEKKGRAAAEGTSGAPKNRGDEPGGGGTAGHERAEHKGEMSVEEAGHKGGQRVRELVQEGKEKEREEGGGKEEEET